MERRLINNVVVTLGPDNLWRDPAGTVIALADDAAVTDPITRCGVGVLSLSPADEWTDACRAHDYAYSSPAYQASHLREEADDKLEADLKLVSSTKLRRLMAPVAAWAARIFGGLFWEKDGTR